MAEKAYTGKNIQVLEGLDAVRKRPGMYIGSNDSRGLHHLIWEIFANSVDEAMSGYGNKIIVTLHKDNSVSILDEGRGLPIDLHSKGKPACEIAFTVLHAGGKFDGTNYKSSAGLHGVGASVVNALSSELHLTIWRDGEIHTMDFEYAVATKDGLKFAGYTNKHGTLVRFTPDKKLFTTIDFSYTLIKEKLQENAFLIKGLEITLIDERQKKEETFCYENGLVSYIEFLDESKNIVNQPVSIENEVKEINVEVAFQFYDGYDSNILSFANNVRTIDGGTHETGFRTAFTKVFNDYARKYGYLKDRDKNFEGNDIREGLTAIVSVRIPEKLLQFESQTKNKLNTVEARVAVESVITEKLSYYLEENKEIAKTIIKKAQQAVEARNAARKARDEARGNKKPKTERLLSGKLAPARLKDKNKIELFIVEGDSAGGSAKSGRDSSFQAILPLRGKVINTEKMKLEDLNKNEEISTMIYTIGAGVGSNFEINDCNYGKVIIMTDADTDGAHIQVLLLTFFYRFMRPLIEAGKVFIAQPPLYKVYKLVNKKETFIYCYNDEDLDKAKKKIGSSYLIQRYKGLGEMNKNQLWETTMDPTTRSLIQVTIDDAAIADRRISSLMGDKAELKRDWIEQNVQFTLEENYGGEE